MVNFRGDSTKENNWKDVEGVAAEETFLLFRKNWMELSNLFSAELLWALSSLSNCCPVLFPQKVNLNNVKIKTYLQLPEYQKVSKRWWK